MWGEDISMKFRKDRFCPVCIIPIALASSLMTGCSSYVISDKIDWHFPSQSSFEPDNLNPKKVYGVSRDTMTWQDAQSFCDDLGDGLATFKSDIENKAFHKAWGK